MRLLEPRADGEETIDTLRQALKLASRADVSPEAAITKLGLGWIGEEALAIATYASIRGGDFREVVRIAANHDGDSDSTASIAAQIRAARDGLDGVPMAWVRRLDVLDPLLVLAHDLWALTSGAAKIGAYPPN